MKFPEKVTPAFGHHPWFSHWISTEKYAFHEQYNKRAFGEGETLQEFISSSEFISVVGVGICGNALTPSRSNSSDCRYRHTERQSLGFPKCLCLEKLAWIAHFRVPVDFSASPRIHTSFHVPLEHQIRDPRCADGCGTRGGEERQFS
jgi:hypothetical protein